MDCRVARSGAKHRATPRTRPGNDGGLVSQEEETRAATGEGPSARGENTILDGVAHDRCDAEGFPASGGFSMAKKANRISQFVSAVEDRPVYVGLYVHKTIYSKAAARHSRRSGMAMTWRDPEAKAIYNQTSEKHGIG